MFIYLTLIYSTPHRLLLPPPCSLTLQCNVIMREVDITPFSSLYVIHIGELYATLTHRRTLYVYEPYSYSLYIYVIYRRMFTLYAKMMDVVSFRSRCSPDWNRQRRRVWRYVLEGRHRRPIGGKRARPDLLRPARHQTGQAHRGARILPRVRQLVCPQSRSHLQPPPPGKFCNNQQLAAVCIIIYIYYTLQHIYIQRSSVVLFPC